MPYCCHKTCTGLATEKCGGYSTLSIMTNPVMLPTGPSLPAGWLYTGCHNESKVDGRALQSYTFSSDAMTVESCVAKCSSLNYSIVSRAGMSASKPN